MDTFLFPVLALTAVVISHAATVKSDALWNTNVVYRHPANPQMNTQDDRENTWENGPKEIPEVLIMTDDEIPIAKTEFHELENLKSPLESIEDIQEDVRDFLIWNATIETEMSRSEFLHRNRQAHDLGVEQSGSGKARLIKCLVSSEQISKPTVTVMYCFGSCYVKYSLGGLFVQQGCTKDKHPSSTVFDQYRVVVYCNEYLCNKPDKKIDGSVPTNNA